MDLEYQQVKTKNNAGIDIRIYFKGINIAMDLASAQWSRLRNGQLDASRALEDFSIAQRNFKTSNNLRYDHAMAMSGKPFKGGVVGIAWVDTVCSPDVTVQASLIEDRNLYLALVAVHELGHFLSADHDPSSGACSGGYIMGPSIYVADEARARIQHEFSSCSITSFVNNLRSLGSNRCTLQHSFTDAEYNAYRSEPIGGEVLSLDQQCQVYFGGASFACNKV
ncbi:hypothetical protein CHS0354_037716 [Potamilus streckersoni]|uniref:Peptidase M12B domain-containing protein n=1 Tax=Potamilus streckersoni TaxID=2493646 RepID=A0AAE0W5V5_9BIVA|nr:hypothetical protein CHS0354_037716 [Potamilus streckersoni]